MDYFYADPPDIGKDTLVIGGKEFAHLTHVMRKREGDRIIVVDGRGNAYESVIETIKKRSAGCRIVSRHESYREPRLRVTLAAALLKNPSRFDFLVEKATELGVAEIIPLSTARTIPRQAKTARWKKLALAAMKQSGRSRLPVVHGLSGISELLASGNVYDRKIIAHEKRPVKGAATGGQGVIPDGSALVLIGPEGGFTDEEVELCLKKGCELLYLGERRLRAETAAIVSLAFLIR